MKEFIWSLSITYNFRPGSLQAWLAKYESESLPI